MTRHFYDYVYLTGGFDQIRRILADSASGWLPAPARVEGSAVRVTLDAGDVEADAFVVVGQPRYEEADARFVIPVAWQSASHPAIFPKMTADLEATPLSHDTCQLTLVGGYRVPAGTVGEVFDRAAGHTFAEAVVHDFLTRVAARLELQVSTLAT